MDEQPEGRAEEGRDDRADGAAAADVVQVAAPSDGDEAVAIDSASEYAGESGSGGERAAAGASAAAALGGGKKTTRSSAPPPAASKSSSSAAAAAAAGKGGAGAARGGGRGEARKGGWAYLEPGVCCLCSKAHVSAHNAIVFCSGCDACYHQACFGTSGARAGGGGGGRLTSLRYGIPPGFWRCGVAGVCKPLAKATAAAWAGKLLALADAEAAVARASGIEW
jgi:hypothetical protein